MDASYKKTLKAYNNKVVRTLVRYNFVDNLAESIVCVYVAYLTDGYD